MTTTTATPTPTLATNRRRRQQRRHRRWQHRWRRRQQRRHRRWQQIDDDNNADTDADNTDASVYWFQSGLESKAENVPSDGSWQKNSNQFFQFFILVGDYDNALGMSFSQGTLVGRIFKWSNRDLISLIFSCKLLVMQEGPHRTMDSILALHPAAPGWIPGIPKVFTEKFFWEGKNCLDEKSVDVA